MPCSNYGILPIDQQQVARRKQVAIIHTVVTDKSDTPPMQRGPISDMTNTTEAQQVPEGTEHDVTMGAVDQTAEAGYSTNTNPTQNIGQEPATHEKLEYGGATQDYEDISEQGDEEEETDAPWLTAALNNLDDRWVERFRALQEQLTKDNSANRKEFQKIKEALVHNAETIDSLIKASDHRFDKLEVNQQKILETQAEQKSSLHLFKQEILSDIESKLTSTVRHLSQTKGTTVQRGPTPHDSYARKAAQPPPNPNEPNQPLPKYTSMAKRVSNTRPPATQTNGVLRRAYIKDWRSEPVGVVKKALRQDIAEWRQAQQMDDNATEAATAWSDLDAVRHVNHFGSLETPLMEIACTPQKV